MNIQFKIDISAQSESVFAAVTTKQGYQGWWTNTCDIDSAIGGYSSIRFEKENLTEEMCFTTIESIPNNKFVWLCTANNVFPSWVTTTITFAISPTRHGCELVFKQSSEDPKWNKHEDYEPSKSGWDFFMDSLKEYCETGSGQPWG